MLNKELLMAGGEQSQRKVALTVGSAAFSFGAVYGYMKGLMLDVQLSVLPYWGTTDNVIQYIMYFNISNSSAFLLMKTDTKVTAFVEGYSTSLPSGVAVKGDLYAMYNDEGSTRYLTFDPPPDGYLDPETQKPI